MKRTASASGFTLLELLVVVAIITIMTGALIPGFSNYINNQNLKQAQEHVKNDLRTVQNKAMTGANSDDLINGNPVNYWGVKFTSGSSTYDYFISYNAVTGTGCPGSDAVIMGKSESLPGGTVIRSTTRCIYFSLKNGDIENGTAVIVGPASGTPCRRVLMNSAGLIYPGTNEQTQCL
jgi:prepilin-type N-terminal cleavage/methylation domain-containing protein